jgi:hypothetical protein
MRPTKKWAAFIRNTEIGNAPIDRYNALSLATACLIAFGIAAAIVGH